MVDKVWNDWQRAHADNFWAFEGGTVRELNTWPRYTNGAPPAMTVGLHPSSLLYTVIEYQRTPQLDFSLPTAGILAGNYSLKRIFNITSNDPLCYTYE